MQCSQCECDATYTNAQRKLCDRHYRIAQMRSDAWTRLQIKHTRQEIEAIIPLDMKCPKCKVDMIWRRRHKQKGVANQITLQHWRDGSIQCLCHRCNVRHASMDEDSFRNMPCDHKFCPCCKTIKHESEFGLKNSRKLLKRNSYCKPCNSARSKRSKEKMDKDAINAYQRMYRAKRKAQDTPIQGAANMQEHLF